MSTLTKVLIGAAITAGAAYLLSRNNKTVSVKPEISTSGVKAKVVVDDEVTEVTTSLLDAINVLVLLPVSYSTLPN